jgi:hypothetical protein
MRHSNPIDEWKVATIAQLRVYSWKHKKIKAVL